MLDSYYPELRHSAALIGSGSEVLGFDTEMSVDHHWGPRVMLFLQPDNYESMRENIRTLLSQILPVAYKGYPTSFSEPDPDDKGTQLLQTTDTGPVNHRVEMYTIKGFFCEYMNIDIEQDLEPADWLTLPQQKLRSVVAGSVFRDDLGLEAVRKRLSWYPNDVWLYILASAWTRIGQEEHLMGRAGLVDDEKGSVIIGSRLVRDIMRLVFLMEKEYPPYAKWLGTAFTRLKAASELEPWLTGALHAQTWQERGTQLSAAYEIIARMHNALKITELVPAEVSHFWGRPFRVIQGERFADAIVKAITDPRVKMLTQRRLIGSIDFFSDNTDLLENTTLRPILRQLFK